MHRLLYRIVTLGYRGLIKKHSGWKEKIHVSKIKLEGRIYSVENFHFYSFELPIVYKFV